MLDALPGFACTAALTMSGIVDAAPFDSAACTAVLTICDELDGAATRAAKRIPGALFGEALTAALTTSEMAAEEFGVLVSEEIAAETTIAAADAPLEPNVEPVLAEEISEDTVAPRFPP